MSGVANLQSGPRIRAKPENLDTGGVQQWKSQHLFKHLDGHGRYVLITSLIGLLHIGQHALICLFSFSPQSLHRHMCPQVQMTVSTSWSKQTVHSPFFPAGGSSEAVRVGETGGLSGELGAVTKRKKRKTCGSCGCTYTDNSSSQSFKCSFH